MSRYLTSHNVCLPGQAPVPATVEFAPASGTILAITPGHRSANAPDGSMIDVGESYVLPGLVECVSVCMNPNVYIYFKRC